ncbi:MAG: PaaI family thioesterase [Alicyclobacillaceae bacterium]|nr:PaaI family thioesterase [Alicyclobacillaceae bacterium]
MGYERCFVCGPDNPRGLHMRFEKYGEEGVIADFESEDWYGGWPGIQHGGVTCAVLDEAAAYVTYNMGLVAVTAQLEVQFQHPIRTGERLQVVAYPLRKTRRLIEVEAKITGEDGSPKAQARAKMMVLSEAQRQAMGL